MLINIEYITKIVQHLNQKVESMQHANLRKNKNILLKRYLKSVGNGPQNWIKLTDLQKEEFGQDLIKLTDIAYARTRLGSYDHQPEKHRVERRQCPYPEHDAGPGRPHRPGREEVRHAAYGAEAYRVP